MKYLVGEELLKDQDKRPIKLGHSFVNHPLLRWEALRKLLPTLPESHVYYSVQRMEKGESFERAITDNRKSTTIEEVMDTLSESQGYIMIREPEKLPEFEALAKELDEDIAYTVRAQQLGDSATNRQLYIFISSPNSITPFHFDRLSNFLFQVSGQKRVTVFKPFDPDVIAPTEYEHHITRTGEISVEWKPEVEPRGTVFTLEAGDALHIPFCSGHLVQNGPEVSISLAVFFSHARNDDLTRAFMFNRYWRKILKPFGIDAAAVGSNFRVDKVKSRIYLYLSRARRLLTGELLRDRWNILRRKDSTT